MHIMRACVRAGRDSTEEAPPHGRTHARTRMYETALRAGVAHQAALHRLFTTWWYFGCFREPAPDDALDVGENQAH